MKTSKINIFECYQNLENFEVENFQFQENQRFSGPKNPKFKRIFLVFKLRKI